MNDTGNICIYTHYQNSKYDDNKTKPSMISQVDLGELKEVTGLVTQGHPLFNFYVERFAVQYSETGLKWDSVKGKDTSYALVVYL